MTDADIHVTTQEIKKQLNKTKTKKAPGPDGMKLDLYKILENSDIYLYIQNNLQTASTKLLRKKK